MVLRVDDWRLVGRRGGLGGAGDRLRAWLRRASAPGLAGERRAVVEGIVLGDDQGLSPSLKTAFRRSGLYHLLTESIPSINPWSWSPRRPALPHLPTGEEKHRLRMAADPDTSEVDRTKSHVPGDHPQKAPTGYPNGQAASERRGG